MSTQAWMVTMTGRLTLCCPARWGLKKRRRICFAPRTELSMSCLTQPRPRPLRKHSPGAWVDRRGQVGDGVAVQWSLQPAVQSLDAVARYSHYKFTITMVSLCTVTEGLGWQEEEVRFVISVYAGQSDDNFFLVKDKQKSRLKSSPAGQTFH